MENKELLEKAKQANSPEELLALAKENGYPLDEDGAKAYFEKIYKLGELSDDELDNVAGGGCGGELDIRKKVTATRTCCTDFICFRGCGYRVTAEDQKSHRCITGHDLALLCGNCKFYDATCYGEGRCNKIHL